MGIEILADLFEFFRIQFESSFNNIPNDNVLSTFYLVGNFILLVLGSFLGGGGIGPGDLLP